jgi:hypothetical protein
MESDSAFSRSPGTVVLDAVTIEYSGAAVIHAYRNGEMVFFHGLTEQLSGSIVQADHLRYPVKLGLSIFIWVIRTFNHHIFPPYINK